MNKERLILLQWENFLDYFISNLENYENFSLSLIIHFLSYAYACDCLAALFLPHFPFLCALFSSVLFSPFQWRAILIRTSSIFKIFLNFNLFCLLFIYISFYWIMVEWEFWSEHECVPVRPRWIIRKKVIFYRHFEH